MSKVKLQSLTMFFHNQYIVEKFLALLQSLNLYYTVRKITPSKTEVSVAPMPATVKKNLIAKWSDLTMERIG